MLNKQRKETNYGVKTYISIYNIYEGKYIHRRPHNNSHLANKLQPNGSTVTLVHIGLQ